MDTRFIRMGSPSVAATVHISPDSRYILLPLLTEPSAVRGWVVFDTIAGVLLEPDNGPDEGVFASMHAARDWVTSHRQAPA